VTEAQTYGLKVQLVLSGVADATWGKACASKPPSGLKPSITVWQQFVEQWLPHYYHLGVHRFSLWNEPNNADFLQGQSNAPAALGKLYRQIAVAGLETISQLQKAGTIGKDVQIFLGEMAGMDFTFLKTLFTGAKIVADGFSYHPYEFCQNPQTSVLLKNSKCKSKMPGISDIESTQKQLTALHKSGKFVSRSGGVVPLYLTEFGYMRTSSNGIPEATRAKWLPLALTVAAKAGVREMNIYQLFPSAPGDWDTSILLANGAPGPSYTALWNWAKKQGYKVKAVTPVEFS